MFCTVVWQEIQVAFRRTWNIYCFRISFLLFENIRLSVLQNRAAYGCSSCGWYLAEVLYLKSVWLSMPKSLQPWVWFPASADSVESKGRQMKPCWIMYIKKKKIKKGSSVCLLSLRWFPKQQNSRFSWIQVIDLQENFLDLRTNMWKLEILYKNRF